jgi:hypothetical protein
MVWQHILCRRVSGRLNLPLTVLYSRRAYTGLLSELKIYEVYVHLLVLLT